MQALVGFRAEVIDSAEFIQGIVNLGTGDRFDVGATQALSPGTYSSMPPKMVHFAWMKGETILQLSSIGPWEVVYVNPTDDLSLAPLDPLVATLAPRAGCAPRRFPGGT